MISRCPTCDVPFASGDKIVKQEGESSLGSVRLHAECRDRIARSSCVFCKKTLSESEFVVFSRGQTGCHKACLGPLVAEQRKREEDHAREHRRCETERRLTHALSMLPRWVHARVDSPEFGKCARQLQSFARSWTRGSALLLGPSGCGKTTCAIAMVYRYVEGLRTAAEANGGHSAEIDKLGKVSWSDGFMLANCRRGHPLGQGDPAAITEAKSAWLTIIDELGFESREASPDIIEVVNARYQHAKPTLVTSGCTMQQFVERYGGAFVRRLAEDGIGTLIDCHPKKATNG